MYQSLFNVLLRRRVSDVVGRRRVHRRARSLDRASILLGSIGVACLATAAIAHDGEDHHHPVTPVQPAELYSPTAMPDRIVLTWNGDPRNSQAVTWRTSTDVKQGMAELAVADATPSFPEQATRFPAQSEPLETDINAAHFHSVEFTNLKPGTKYAYRVGDGTNWSEWFHFSTASAENEPFSFIYFGDAQNDIRSMWSRVIREAYGDAPDAAFLLHAGDLVNRAESDAEWGEWFGAGAWLNAMVPNVVVPGNHEQAKLEDGTRRLSHHWRPSFTLPTHGPKGVEETCYTLIYHNLRVIALNSSERQAEQAEWLEQVLEQNEAPWVICTFHHPIYSTGKDRDNPELRALWKPIFDEYKVDLVLQGHDHTYGRTGLQVPSTIENGSQPPVGAGSDGALPLGLGVNAQAAPATIPQTVSNVPTGVQKVDGQTGTVYVVSVSGPKMYNHRKQSFMQRVAEDTQLYQVIHIDGGKLRFEARTAVGQLYDAFELHKQPGRINELIEIEPEVPQNLRAESPDQ